MPHELEIVRLVTQLGSFGILVYLTIWGMPQLLQIAREEMKLQREEFTNERQALRRRIDQLLEFHLQQGEEIIAMLRSLTAAETARSRKRPSDPPSHLKPFPDTLPGDKP